MALTTPAITDYTPILNRLGFVPEDAPGAEDWQAWYRRGDLRVVIDDITPTVYALNPHGVARWSATLRHAPAAVLFAVLAEAIQAGPC